MFGSRKAFPALDRKRSLAGIPVLNEGVAVTAAEAGAAQIRVRVRRGAGLLARFQPAEMERNVKLDELGAFVLRQIDGERDVRSIVDRFVARFSVNRREAELSTVAFLRSLAERGVVSIVIR